MLKRFPLLIGVVAALAAGMPGIPLGHAQGTPYMYFRRIEAWSSSSSSSVLSSSSASSVTGAQNGVKKKKYVCSHTAKNVAPEAPKPEIITMPNTGAGDGTDPVEDVRAFLTPAGAGEEKKWWSSWLW